MHKRSRGRPPHPDQLTPAEWETMNLVRHGLSNREIARKRGTSLDATKFHIANIAAKLGLADKQAIREWSGWPAASAHDSGGCIPMTNIALGQIGQISLTITDVSRAETFYRDTLGLPHLFTFGQLAFFDCGGTRLFLTVPEHKEERQNSVIYFRVPSIHDAYEQLRSKDVPFEGAPHMIHRHEDGTEEWMAFFRDPDGNLLAIMAQMKA
ncbi:hypothetical protein AYO38_01490 [bacterium SCGC AG-212-C10]|nr:hypothetical protein AYO38_01490 [bacterium SCGC AG-212-C10]